MSNALVQRVNRRKGVGSACADVAPKVNTTAWINDVARKHNGVG